jgi:tetratricopeptide (TPR) repeat protein
LNELPPSVSVRRGAGALALLLALLVLALTAWIYWPGISGPTLLDDRSSVLVIGDVKSSPELALDYVFGDSSGLFGRSVSMGSFVLEKLYLDEGTVGSKKVNIVLHVINGGLLIWLLWLLFRFLCIPGYQWLAVILGATWLLHPLLVSTVLYVVQRMAMLATFFMLAASIAYVYWRVALAEGKASILRFLPVPALIFIGLLAKENAIVVVPILLLMEVLWFRFEGPGGAVLHRLKAVSYALIAIGSVALLSMLLFRYGALQENFSRRSFSLEERLLTESRIVWDYVGQWFVPEVARMGLYHDDVVLSHSLLEPAATLYSVIAWLLLVLACGVLLRWSGGRWLVFGIAWFVLGHSVESTVLPLELYFEHRNYFPAIGLLIGVGALFATLVKRWPEPAAPLVVCLGVWLLVLSALTSSQVQIWSSRSLLILNHLNAHPGSSRANTDMAVEMANLGQLEAARHYSRKAFEASSNAAGLNERFGDYEIRNLALSCLSNRAVSPELIDNLGKVNPDRPLSSVTTLLTMVRLLQDNHCPEFDRIRFADRLAEIFLVDDFRQKASANIYSNLAVLENALGRYDNAYAYVERFLVLSPRNKRGLLMKLHFATALGKTDAAGEAIAALQELDRQGRLTVGEQTTLGLYLEK